MKKLMATMLLGLGLALGLACDGPTSSACGDDETIGKCTDVKYCCNASIQNTSCYYQANGKKYSCTNATDCAAAAQELAADCQ